MIKNCKILWGYHESRVSKWCHFQITTWPRHHMTSTSLPGMTAGHSSWEIHLHPLITSENCRTSGAKPGLQKRIAESRSGRTNDENQRVNLCESKLKDRIRRMYQRLSVAGKTLWSVWSNWQLDFTQWKNNEQPRINKKQRRIDWDV